MVRKMTQPVRRHVGGYVYGFRAFSHNSRTYLYSVLLQTLGGSMVGCVFALYLRAEGMRESSLGYVEGAIALATAGVALLGPPLVAALGYRALMLGALVLLVLSRVAQAMLPVAGVLVALGVAVGLGDGFLRTVNSAFLTEHGSDDQRTHLFSTEFLLRMLGVFLGGVIGGLLPSLIGGPEAVGYQWTIGLGAAAMAAGLVPMARIEERPAPRKGFWRRSLEAGREFSSWSHLIRLAVPQSFLVMAGALVGPFVPLYLMHELGASVGQVGLIQGVGALVVGLTALATPAIRRRVGVGRGVTALQVLSVPLLMAVPYVGGLLSGVALLFVRSSVMGASGPLYAELSMESVRTQDKPLVGGGLLFTLSIMGFLGSVMGGRLMEQSYTAPYLPAAVLYAIGTALTYAIWVWWPARKAAAEAGAEALSQAA